MAINIEIRVYHDTGDTSSNPAAAQAGCTATCKGYYSGTKTYTGGHPRPGESGGTTSVAYTNYQLTATHATGWYFKGWDVITRNYITGGLDSQGNVRTDVEITTERTYHSDTNPYPANTTTTDYEFPGDLAEANPGYDWQRHTFKWEIIAVYAQFEQGDPPATYTVKATASPSNGGTVQVGSAAAGSTSTLTNITAGSTVTVVATPETGYHFVSWSDGGAQTHDVTVNSDINLTATFEADTPTTYTITTAVSPAGAGSVTGGGQYSSGTTVTLQALPNAGYGVAYWQKDGVMVQGSERQSSLSIAVTSNATYTAVFQTETKVTVTLVATDFGLVHFKDDSAAPSQGPIIKTFTNGSVYSDTFTVEAITKNGSVFKYWTISGWSGKWYDAELYRYAPDSDTTITAYFALPIEAYARQFDNKLIPAGDPCPNGEVRIMAGSETTDWGQHVYLEITEAIEVTVEQRSTGGGWSLVYFKTIDMANGQVITSFGQDWRNYPYRDHGYIVNALFSRSPTNLLVNSSTVESPAKLVYDPATNKLVADY